MASQAGKSTRLTSGNDVTNRPVTNDNTAVPGIYVEGESFKEQNISSSRGRRDKKNSSLSNSLDALTASSSSVFSQENANSLDDASKNGKHVRKGVANVAVNELSCREEDSLLPLGTYYSPRLNRRQRSGSYPIRDNRYPVRDLSSLRAEGYLKFKSKGGRSRVNSGESRESGDTLDNASHLSTCATSDYAFMTSLDTLNLCHSCASVNLDTAYHHGNHRRPLSLDVEAYSGIRRTHSNPENCQSDSNDQNLYDSDDNNYGTLKSTNKGLEDVKADLMTSQHKYGAKDQSEDVGGTSTEHVMKLNLADLAESNSDALGEVVTSRGRRKSSKPIAVSEENLVSRVSRWLSTMEQPETRDLETF